MLRTGTMMAAFATASAMLWACGGDDKQAQNPQQQQCPQGQYFDGQFCQNMQGQQQQQPPPAQTATTAPPPTSPIPVATATAGAPAQQADAATATAATALLTPLAKQHAPGAKPLGTAVAGNFQQGQSLETTVQMSPGKCYTVVGVGMPPITDLDIQLVPTAAIPGLPAAVIAADNSAGAQAIVAGAPNCFKWALPLGAPVKMIVTAKAGSGVAAAQVYE